MNWTKISEAWARAQRDAPLESLRRLHERLGELVERKKTGTTP